MKKIFTLTCSALLAIGAQAQITINQSSFASWTPGVDTFRDLTANTSVPSANGSWDMSNASYFSGSFTIPKPAYSNPALPGVTYTVASSYGFSALSYLANLGYGVSSQGLLRIGESIDRQAFSIASITTNTQDSVVFPAQTVLYSTPRKILSFPMTAGTNWMTDMTANTNFQISITSYGLNHTPGYRRAHVTQKDSVKGWGRLRVQNLAGNASGWMDVLAVKTTIDVADSFYLNGAPAPVQLLTAMGLSQGMQDHVYRIAYYRAGEVEPAMFIQYTDATFATVRNSDVHVSRLPAAATAVQGVSGTTPAISCYPNPAASGGDLNIDVTETAPGVWRYALINTAGQVVSTETLNLNGGKARIGMRNTVPGNYILSVSKDGQPVSAKQLVIKN